MELFVYGNKLFGNNDNKAVHHTPQNKVGGDAVPNAGAEPGCYGSNVHRQPLTKVAKLLPGRLGEFQHRLADGDGVEDVVLHPFAQGDVPAAPVFGNVLGEEGAHKVFRQLDAQYFRDADGDVNATGKVSIDLHSVEDHQQQKTNTGIFRPF